MRIIEEQFAPTVRGGILYDASRLRKPGNELFSREHWAQKDALEEVAGGRGSIAVLRAEDQRWVLRHYRRGGLIAKLSEDRYWWRGAANTRSFAEWRLLAELYRSGLPVPAPIAARYVRGAFTYRADLITEELPATQTLANSISAAALTKEAWCAVGRTVALFHAHGVHHADLNAHNILLSAIPSVASGRGPVVFLLDFDRGRIRARGPWEAEVLGRLRRSLEKIRRQRRNVRFADPEWGWLMEGYGAKEADSG